MKKTLDKPEQSEEAFGCPTWDCAGVRVSARVTMESREVLLSSFKVTEVFVFVFFFAGNTIHKTREMVFHCKLLKPSLYMNYSLPSSVVSNMPPDVLHVKKR